MDQLKLEIDGALENVEESMGTLDTSDAILLLAQATLLQAKASVVASSIALEQAAKMQDMMRQAIDA
jgi:predicted metal-dependent hydrolase